MYGNLPGGHIGLQRLGPAHKVLQFPQVNCVQSMPEKPEKQLQILGATQLPFPEQLFTASHVAMMS